MNYHYKSYLGILLTGVLVCQSFTICGGGDGDTFYALETKPSSNKGALLTAAVAGTALVGLYIAYLNNKRVRLYVQDKGYEIKQFCIDRIGGPLYLLYERIRDKGLTQKDVTIGTLALCGLYGTKKAGDHYELWSSIYNKDFSGTRKVLADDIAFISRHKGKFALGAGVVAILGWMIKTGVALSMIERFKRSLTTEQKELISADAQLKELVDKAHEDPHALVEHGGLTVHLKDHQRDILARAVEIHKRERNPLGLLDDLVFEGEMDLT